ncbi:MAG: hypothetical protein WAO23_00065 [Dethiobacteria bacterium]
MRKAVLVLALIFLAIILVQAYFVGVGGETFEDLALSRGGAVGRLVALMFGVGAAFVLAKPFVSIVVFGIAALVSLIVAYPTGYYDLFLWGIIAIVLGVLSYFGWREIDDQPSFRHRQKDTFSVDASDADMAEPFTEQ